MFPLAAFSELNSRQISDAILCPRFSTFSQSEGFSNNLQEFLLGGCYQITRALIFFFFCGLSVMGETNALSLACFC